MAQLIRPMKFIFSFILTLWLVACASTPDEIKLLDKSFALYEHALRWQDYDVLIGFHKNERDKLTQAKRQFLKQFRVSGYNVVYSNVAADQRHANQIIEIKYYNQDYGVLREMTLNNQWEYDEKALRWQLTNPIPDFR